jgi:tetratricopeptide (TPR) repeat protein
VLELLESLALPAVDARVLAPMLTRHAGGNPLFMLETLRAMLAQGDAAMRGAAHLPAPSSVGELIERRLNQLTPPALRLARVAALAGRDFSAELAATVLGRHALDIADAWRELEAAQVIRDSAFAHDLIFEATLRSVPAPIARLLHRDIATYLEAHGSEAVRTAGHWFEAQEWSRAGAAFKTEADRIRTVARGVDAAELYRRAAESFDRAGQRTERIEALWQLSACLQFMKKFNEYSAVAEQMCALAVTPQERVMALEARAKAHFEACNDEQGLVMMREARQLARETGNKMVEVSMAEWEALGLGLLGRHQEALAVGRIVLRFIEDEPNDEFIALRKRQYAYLLELDNQFEEACKFLQEADQRALADGDLGLLSEIRVIRAACRHNLGELDAAIDDYQSARRLLLDRSGGTRRWSGYDSMTARCLTEAGQYRQAIEMLTVSLEDQKTSDDSWHRIPCEVALALCFIVLGQPGRAKPLVDESGAADEMQRAGCLNALVRIARTEGKPAKALLERLLELAGRSPRGERLRWQTRIDLCREMDAQAAIAVAHEVAQQSLAKKTYTSYLPAKAMLVDALRRAGQLNAAADEALQLARLLSTRAAVGMYAPEYWWLIFQALDARGEIRLPQALDALRRGVDWIHLIALPNVPPDFRDSFLNRNPVNRAILTTASRRLRH